MDRQLNASLNIYLKMCGFPHIRGIPRLWVGVTPLRGRRSNGFPRDSGEAQGPRIGYTAVMGFLVRCRLEVKAKSNNCRDIVSWKFYEAQTPELIHVCRSKLPPWKKSELNRNTSNNSTENPDNLSFSNKEQSQEELTPSTSLKVTRRRRAGEREVEELELHQAELMKGRKALSRRRSKWGPSLLCD